MTAELRQRIRQAQDAAARARIQATRLVTAHSRCERCDMPIDKPEFNRLGRRYPASRFCSDNCRKQWHSTRTTLNNDRRPQPVS